MAVMLISDLYYFVPFSVTLSRAEWQCHLKAPFSTDQDEIWFDVEASETEDLNTSLE